MTTTKKAAAPKAARAKPVVIKKQAGTPAGRKILAAMNELGNPKELARTLAHGAAPDGVRFTVVRPAVAALDGPGVAAIRGDLGMSQSAFAAALNVSVQTVQAWEQGRNPVNGIAARFLTAIRDDLPYWRKKLAG